MSGNPWERNAGKFDVPSSSAIGEPIRQPGRRKGEPGGIIGQLSASTLTDEEARFAYRGIEPVLPRKVPKATMSIEEAKASVRRTMDELRGVLDGRPDK